MNTKIKKGMIVCISDNIEASIKIWGGRKDKSSMKGKNYRVVYIDRTSVDVMHNNGKTYAFELNDITPALPTPPIPPAMFDPKNIDF